MRVWGLVFKVVKPGASRSASGLSDRTRTAEILVCQQKMFSSTVLRFFINKRNDIKLL